MKIAFIVQRYGKDIIGGAEYHCRLIVKHLKPYFDIEVFTSKAYDYITWKDHYREDIDKVDGVVVNRFSVKKPRDPEKFGKIQEKIFNYEHTIEDELLWLNEEGPNLPELIKALKKREDEFKLFIFFSYRYFHSYYGIKEFNRRTLLVPTAEPDPVLYMKIFKEIFSKTGGIVYNSWEEKKLLNKFLGGKSTPGDVVGVGSEIPDKTYPLRFRKKFGIEDDFLIYIGRIDENKGVPHMFEYFKRYIKEENKKLKLILVGKEVYPVPEDNNIIYLGPLNDEDKFNALSAAELLIMPSFYESLSMVTIESWALKKPVLVNGRCPVLKAQVIRSKGGLYYEDYFEFKEALNFILGGKKIQLSMGENGRSFYLKNYTWKKIIEKYLALIEKVIK